MRYVDRRLIRIRDRVRIDCLLFKWNDIDGIAIKENYNHRTNKIYCNRIKTLIQL